MLSEPQQSEGGTLTTEPRNPGIADRALLLEIAGGEAEARDVLTLYFTSARDLMARCRDAADQEDRDRLGHAAHQMAGAAGTCGFARAESRMRALEQAAATENWPELHARVDEVADLLGRIESEARILFPQPSPER